MVKTRNGADDKENHFDRLPEDLVIFIFNKVADLKCLCRCSLVSKHFASLIPHVRTVSLAVTGSGTYNSEYVSRIVEFLKELDFDNVVQLHKLLDSFSLQHMKFPVFLGKIKEIECIDLEYHYPEKSTESPFPMRKIKFYSNGAKIESFVGLEPRYMYKDTENEPDEEEDIEYRSAAINRAKESRQQLFARYMEWFGFIYLLSECHASVYRVTITDSEVNGKLVIGDERHIINIRVALAC